MGKTYKTYRLFKYIRIGIATATIIALLLGVIMLMPGGYLMGKLNSHISNVAVDSLQVVATQDLYKEILILQEELARVRTMVDATQELRRTLRQEIFENRSRISIVERKIRSMGEKGYFNATAIIQELFAEYTDSTGNVQIHIGEN